MKTVERRLDRRVPDGLTTAELERYLREYGVSPGSV